MYGRLVIVPFDEAKEGDLVVSLLPAVPRSVMKGHHLMQAHLITRVPPSLQEPSRPAQVEERLPNQLQSPKKHYCTLMWGL
ncbi:hypothetical protein EMCRGX_G015587 [Ephydatia muelleri]